MFFGTPHGGANETLVAFGEACAKMVRTIMVNPSKDIMKALKHGSLFSDVLQEGWRHQLSLYKIISFYEGIGTV